MKIRLPKTDKKVIIDEKKRTVTTLLICKLAILAPTSLIDASPCG